MREKAESPSPHRSLSCTVICSLRKLIRATSMTGSSRDICMLRIPCFVLKFSPQLENQMMAPKIRKLIYNTKANVGEVMRQRNLQVVWKLSLLKA